MLHEFRAEQKHLRKTITDIMWHMRGSVSREDAWAMSYEEREDIFKLIEERLKIVEKTGLPLL